jgi:transposase
VTRTGGIPLAWHAYPGNRPDVTQFPTLIDHLVRQYTHSTTVEGTAPTGADPAGSMTVVFDAGQNSAGNFAHLAEAGLRFIGSVPPTQPSANLARKLPLVGLAQHRPSDGRKQTKTRNLLQRTRDREDQILLFTTDGGPVQQQRERAGSATGQDPAQDLRLPPLRQGCWAWLQCH